MHRALLCTGHCLAQGALYRALRQSPKKVTGAIDSISATQTMADEPQRLHHLLYPTPAGKALSSLTRDCQEIFCAAAWSIVPQRSNDGYSLSFAMLHGPPCSTVACPSPRAWQAAASSASSSCSFSGGKSPCQFPSGRLSVQAFAPCSRRVAGHPCPPHMRPPHACPACAQGCRRCG